MSLRWIAAASLVLLCVARPSESADEETLPPLKDGRVPESANEIWAGFDPEKEPLETEILKEWEDDGIVCRIVRYRIGVFKGTKSVMAGIYAFPEGGHRLPGLVQIHGGGQSANLNAATTNARRGYACISLNWGGQPAQRWELPADPGEPRNRLGCRRWNTSTETRSDQSLRVVCAE